ncbi:MAG: penicillin-binding protein 2 [Nocardioides sp.]|nr:penicillin-binding protein 2 [Nocardioides sp.]
MSRDRRTRSTPPARSERIRRRRRVTAFRLRVGIIVVTMVLSVFGARLFQLQGIDPGSYAVMAQQAGLVEVALPARRGAVLDRTGAPLAESLAGSMVVADPLLTRPDASGIARIVAEDLDVDYFETLNRLQREDTRFQYLARRVPTAVAESVLRTVEEAGYEGLTVRRDPMRDYPARDVAANLLGFMGAEGEPMGGLELAFDPLLEGRDGKATYEVGAGGARIPLGDNSVEEPRDGEDLRLTIDRDVQWYTQRVLRQAVEGSGGSSGAAVAMDVRTGEVLALADHPTFDANQPLLVDKGHLGSRALSDVYEPGSVSKVLTAAALLDAGKVTPRTRILVPGQLPRQDRVINDYWDHGRLRLTLTGVLAKSSNIGTVLAADEFSPEELHGYLSDFGLGARTGVGVGGEARGLLTDWNRWSQINQDTIAFGQGLSVTVLQMAAAVNTIANDGVHVSPSIVRGSATHRGGRAVGTHDARTTRVVSEEAARATATMMETVTRAGEGTAPGAAIEGYRVAGKTGTAQRVDEECGCYRGFTVSFAGFAPADDPRFLVYVVVQEPQNGGGGGSVGGPAFRDIMSYLLRKYAVPPTGVPAPRLPLEW